MNEVTYVLAALLDVIGYRNRLERDRVSGRLDLKDALQKAMNILSDVNETDYAYQAISDTIIITSANVTDLAGLLSVLKKVQLSFLREGLLVRGGVAHERHFKSNTITYSHALALAYQLEVDVAVYPRIVIEHNVIELQRGDTHAWLQLSSSSLVCEWNGVYFLNILDHKNWLDVYNWANSIYASERETLVGKEKEFLKHAWFEHYLFGSPFAKDGHVPYIPSPKLLTERSTG